MPYNPNYPAMRQLLEGLGQLDPLNPPAAQTLAQPKPLSQQERMALRQAIVSGGLTDLAGIFLGQAPQGRSEAALQALQFGVRPEGALETEAQKTRQFNVGQENQFGRTAFQQQAALQRQQAQLQAQVGLQGQRDEASMARAELQHQARLQQIDVAEQNARTAEERARIQQQRADETGRHNLQMEEINRLRAETQATRGKKFLDPSSRNQLAELSAGSKEARSTLEAFRSLGGNVGGPVAGRVPSMFQLASTRDFNAKLVASVARLRKLLAGSAVTPTELAALLPLLPDITRTPQEIVSGLEQIANFFETKSEAMLAGLEASGVVPEAAEEARRVYGRGQPAAPQTGPAGPNLSAPESEQQKLDRIKKRLGL